MKTVLAMTVLLIATDMSLRAAPLVVSSDRFTASFSLGGLSSLQDRAGNRYVSGSTSSRGAAIRRVTGDHWAKEEQGLSTPGAEGRATVKYSGFTDLEGATLTATCEIDKASKDVVVTQSCQSPSKGVWGVAWAIANIPLDMNIIVPGYSGIRLTKRSPGASFTFDYPISWEAQLVILEGKGRGFYLWSEDALGKYKRLTVNRNTEGWRLELTSLNFAPFDEQTTCDSVRWHVNVYEGDWRVPARRYRDWAEKNLMPTKVVEQQPAWVKDIRCCVIMGMDLPQIELLAKRLDPKQTLLYLPGWRKAGYDRDYPTYDQMEESLGPFVKRARELGYRVMLHVNYFGVDPLNPLYQQFEHYQVRDPWGNHEKQWWLWVRADPIIKFAYINPAHKAWRELFVARMKRLCESVPIDALHLDQTICIFNDHNGLVDGMSMLQGNVALHKELRAALPHIALSGEGLDEVTYRYEAFAQRHSYGLDFVQGTWNKPSLRMAHPISSYLFRPYTILYGYLGCAPPTSGQLYAAWNENYQHWAVIPTLKPDTGQIDHPTDFSRQFFDEVKLWQQEKVDIDVESPWPDNVSFPFKTAKGERVVRTSEGRLLRGATEVSRTISDSVEVRLPGTIPGWNVYDRERLFGLDPDMWFAYLAEPRDMNAFHVDNLPEAFTASAVVRGGDMAVLRTRQTSGLLVRLAEKLNEATCGSKPFDGGESFEARGPLTAPDGAGFNSEGSIIYAHPPWKATRKNPQTGVLEAGGTGIAYARFNLTLPATGKLRFASDVAMDAGAVGPGKTDGVTYGVTARRGQQELHGEIHNATADRKELSLDLTSLAGQDITLELTVHPGPQKNATFDWARWYQPRVEREVTMAAEMVVVSPQDFNLALTGTTQPAVKREGNRYTMQVGFPGATFLLNATPPVVRLPLDLAHLSLKTTYLSNPGGLVLDSPQYATAVPAEGVVGGVKKAGLFTHPPNQGRTIIDTPMTLPDQSAEFHSFIGLRDGSKSEGVLFIVEANGIEIGRQRMMPGAWRELTCDLSPWKGKPVVLSLITDSKGGFDYDWAQWGDPVVR